MPPAKNPLGPLPAEKLPPEEKSQDFSSKELGQPGVVDSGNLMEHPRLVHSAIGHQKMEVGVKI